MSTPGFQVAVAPVSAAADEPLVQHLVAMINDAYTKAEAGIWAPTADFSRTDTADLQHCIRASELIVAWAAGEHLGPSTVLGVVRLEWRRPAAGGDDDGPATPLVAMLACDPAARGTGLGTALVRRSEAEARQRGAAAIQIDLLTPRAWDHPEKVRLAAWYKRSGYAAVRVDKVETYHAWLVPMLAGPSDMNVLEKKL